MSDIRAQSRRDAEFDRLLSQTITDGTYLTHSFSEQSMREAYEMGDRHRAEQCPRWHDAPTCPGLWVFDGDAYDVYLWDGGRLMVDDGGIMEKPWEGRWFGPIPDCGVTR